MNIILNFEDKLWILQYKLNDEIETRDFLRNKIINKIGLKRLFIAMLRDSNRKIKAINGRIKNLKGSRL